MYILGMQLGHNATISLMKDGVFVSAVSQEKFDNVKNSSAFPAEAILWTLKNAGITPQELDAVAVAGLTVYPHQMAMQGGRKNSPVHAVWEKVDYSNTIFRDLAMPVVKNKRDQVRENGRKQLLKLLADTYGIHASKIHFVEHHVAHAYTGFYFFGGKTEEGLVLTMDGSGDYYFASVNRAKGEAIERIASSEWEHSLGYIYSLTTKFLGMKPLEHEYKVMGLAPYAKDYYLKTYEEIFKPVIWLDKKDPLKFDSAFPLNRFDLYLREKAVGVRFDNIAAALQHLTEDVVSRWAEKAIEKTGLSEVYTSGGVFMNVKLNLKLSELEGVEKLNLLPSCGDDSNPFGAAYYVYQKLGGKLSGIKPVKQLYLGPGFSDEEVGEYIKKEGIESKYAVQHYDDVEKAIAEKIAAGEVVARFAGRCEWGARALGNRTILGDPSKMDTFYKINDQIKMRDFWMPFAPSIMKERELDYIVNPKGIVAPYMVLAFNSTELARKELRACMHQADHTLRPQIVEKDWNPSYYKILKEFENLTGIGGIMNTSFNLHGYPIACTPEQAMFTFENSGLENLAMENYIISKNTA